jgi:hypothetical protein
MRCAPLRRDALLALAGFALLGTIAGCSSCGDAKKSSAAPAASKAPLAKAVVEGVVRLAPGAELPSYPPEQMEKKVVRVGAEAPPDVCTPPKVTDRQPVRLTSDGLLAGVMLAPSGFSHQPERAPLVHDVTIEDCRLTPSLVVAMKGDSLRVRNTVNYAFMPSYDQGPMVRTLTPGQTYDVPLSKPGVLPLLCGFTATCGRTDVVVLMHPYYAVTDAQGKFRFEDFPAGEPVSLSAWHPLFQEAKIQLEVAPGEHKQVELVLMPAQPLPPPPAATQDAQGARDPVAPQKRAQKPAVGGATRTPRP